MQLDGEAIGTYDIKRIYLVSEMLDVKKQKEAVSKGAASFIYKRAL